MIPIEGIPVEAGGKKWIVPEMRAKTARMYLPYLSGEKEMPAERAAMLDLMTDTVHSILHPNYPELTRDEVEELFSTSEYNRIIAASAEAAHLERLGESGRESRPEGASTGDTSTRE